MKMLFGGVLILSVQKAELLLIAKNSNLAA